MIFQHLQAYASYYHKAKHHNGHGIHSPFMYELVHTVFSAEKTAGEPRNKQERIVARLGAFCKKYGLNLVQVREQGDLILYKENCIAILAQPHFNAKLWRTLVENKNTKVTADCWKFGLALAVAHLQKQDYTIKV